MSREKDTQKKIEASDNKLSIKDLLSGAILVKPFVQRQGPLLALVVLLTLLYIANRYAAEHEIREVNKLRKELTDTRYNILHLSSLLAEKSRQSHIEEQIKQQNSALKTATNPPYVIKD